MFNDEDGCGSVSVSPIDSLRSNQFAAYQVTRLTLYAEAVHNAKVQ